MPRRELDRGLRDGTIVQAVRGAYLAASLADDPVARARALALVLPPGAAVALRTAAWLHGIDAREPGQHTQPLPLECVVPVGRAPVRRPGVISRQATLSPQDVVVVRGIPVTSAERTALDLARRSPPHMGLAVLDALAHAGQIDRDRLAERLGAWTGERGVARARRLVDLCEPATESFGESWLRLRAVDAGFPRPEPQIQILDAWGRPVYRLDMGWRERRQACEYDGEEFHSSPVDRIADQRRRAVLAQRYGWTVIGVGRGEVLGRRLDLEFGLGELLGLAPSITRRSW